MLVLEHAHYFMAFNELAIQGLLDFSFHHPISCCSSRGMRDVKYVFKIITRDNGAAAKSYF